MNSDLREFKIHKTRLNRYFYDNRPSRFLASKLKNSTDQSANITTIMTDAGTQSNDPKLINEFLHYYKDLYSADSKMSTDRIDNFLCKLKSNSLPTE